MLDKDILLSSYGNWGDESAKMVYIDNLEEFIVKCNKSIDRGVELVSNSVYITLIDYLTELRPNSPVLHTIWDVDDNSVDFSKELDYMLKDSPILSIQVAKSVKDGNVKQFKEKLYNYPIEVMCAIKLSGQPIRVVYKDGVLVKATTRSRSAKGRDLTSQAITILGKKNNSLKGRGIVELRGDIVLPVGNLDKAKEYNSNITNIFNGLSCLLKDSVSDKEVRLLDIVFTDILGDMFMFDSMTSKYQLIERDGFETPLAFIDKVEKYSFEDDIVRIVGKMEVYTEDYKYNTEGVVLSIDDIEMFNTFGGTDKYSLGNMLLKLGQWRQESYSGVIKDIKWLDSNGKKTPVAILEEGITVGEGKVINSVPLYAPCYILMLEAYIGNKIHFRYAGDLGVIPSTIDGKIVVDKTDKG